MSVGYGECINIHSYFDLHTSGPSIEHVDVPALARRGIRLGYTPDVLTDAGKCILSLHVRRDELRLVHAEIPFFSCGCRSSPRIDGYPECQSNNVDRQ